MLNSTDNKVAANAVEAKVITDSFINSLTKEEALQHISNSNENGGVLTYFHNLSYEIGTGGYYYGIECKQFCNDILLIKIVEKAIAK